MSEFELLVLKKLEDLSERLNLHMEEEEGQIKHMAQKFIALQQTVSSYGDKTNELLHDMQSAFLEHETESGKRDYAGHYYDHKTRKRWYDRWTGWVADGVGNMVKIAMASGAAWLVYEIWTHLLRGPK